MVAELDRYVVLKLVSGEEILTQLITEDDYEVRCMFPMAVKHVPRSIHGQVMDSIVLGAWTHFSASDEYTFTKQHVLFIQDMDPRYIDEYHKSVDDFLGHATTFPQEAYNPNEMKELAEKLQNMFRREEFEEELPDVMVIPDTSKLIH